MIAAYDPYLLLALQTWVLVALYYALLGIMAWALGVSAIRRYALFF